MRYKLFSEMRLSKIAKVPFGYRRSVRWLPRIGDIVPDVHLETTQGPLDFHAWAEGRWVILFSHPGPLTAVCTTEIASLAALAGEFEARGVALLGISGGSPEDHARWAADIRDVAGVAPLFPLSTGDPRLLAELFGMIHSEASADWAIRKTLVVGPDLRVRMILEYPVLVGRSSEELLRVVDALQTAETFNVGIGADWQRGDDLLLLPSTFGPPRVGKDHTWRRVCAYLWTGVDPRNGRPAAALPGPASAPGPVPGPFRIAVAAE